MITFKDLGKFDLLCHFAAFFIPKLCLYPLEYQPEVLQFNYGSN